MAEAKPKCPECGVEGIEHFTIGDIGKGSPPGVPRFESIYCDGCGHVYQVFQNFIRTKDATGPLPGF